MIPFELCKDYLDDLIIVPEGKICQTILELYNKDGIVVNDPFGKLNPTPKGGWAQANVSGDNDTKGMGVTYPKSLMDGIWVDRGPGTGRMVTPGKGGVKPGQAAPGDSGDNTGSLSEDSSVKVLIIY